uniref:Uncharacterized protein n=1 Tax=Arundo donax TaxID=35708 RepID=A0A0A8ZK29_ARUDO
MSPLVFCSTVNYKHND